MPTRSIAGSVPSRITHAFPAATHPQRSAEVWASAASRPTTSATYRLTVATPTPNPAASLA
jgi:hypothetical protein